MNWSNTIPSCAPSECFAAPSLGEALYFALLELDLIDEGQEAADHYTKRDIRHLRRWVSENRLTLAKFMGTTPDSLPF
ncbi:MAG: hypothetical protein K8T25_07090 [Planctomycetia bacterium]|nr:hypothetical protein [Planctomycetia bacterium]